MSGILKVAVLVSGSGTNLQALLDRFGADDERIRITRVIGSRPRIGALERARAADVPCAVLPAPDEDVDTAGRLLGELDAAEADLTVLAGFLRLIPEPVVRSCRGRMINIHPALLPAFGGPGMYGRRVHEAVLASGARVTGATVHFVDEVYDRGAIIAQWPVPVHDGDDAGTLAARVLAVEHRLLPAVVDAFAAGAFELDENNRCRWHRPWFAGDAFIVGEQT